MEHLVKQKQYHLLNSDDTRGFEGRCSHVVYRHCIYNIFFTQILTSETYHSIVKAIDEGKFCCMVFFGFVESF